MDIVQVAPLNEIPQEGGGGAVEVELPANLANSNLPVAVASTVK